MKCAVLICLLISTYCISNCYFRFA